MNSNQAKGSAKDAAGKVQRKLGQLLGSTKHRVKGAQRQAEGKAQKAAGDVEEDIEEMRDKSARDNG